MQLSRLQSIIRDWGQKTFPNKSVDGMIIKLQEEVDELKDAFVVGDKKDIIEEIADCMIMLMAISNEENISIEKAIMDKHKVNEKRNWEDTGRGYYNRK